MKKFIVSLSLIVFLFSAFYPVIYATENRITNEEIKTNEVPEEEPNIVEQEEETKTENIVEIEQEDIPTNTAVSNEIEPENVLVEETIITNEPEEKEIENASEEVVLEEDEISNELEEQQMTRMRSKADTMPSYSGRVYIEKPANNQTVTLPNNNQIKIEGWAVSNDENAILKLYVDNKFVQDVSIRTVRGDVDSTVSAEYGGTGKTPKAGFETEVDISALAAGNHVIKIEQQSKNGDIIGNDEKTIKVGQAEYKGKMNIESFPLLTYYFPESDTMNVYGWAVSNDAEAKMMLTIDGKQYPCTTVRTKRPDVDSAVSGNYGGTANTPKAGFSMNVKISDLSKGMHTVVVSEVSRYGKTLASAKVQLKIETTKYVGRMYVEKPTNNEAITLPNTKQIKIEGWAVSNDEKAVLKLYVDNKYIKNIDKRTTRGDVNTAVSGNYGGTGKTPKAGFEIEYDVSSLAAGNHTIKVEEVSRFGEVVCKDEKTIKVGQVEYKGKMNIESFPLLTYYFPESDTMNVYGWAVSNDAEAKMTLTIDGKQYPCTTVRTKRPDVDSAVSGNYGGTANTPKAGFSMNVKISDLSKGMHTVVVSEVSRYGKTLVSAKVQLKIETTKYVGRMYVEKPTNNASITLPNTKQIKIEGWAVSNDEKAVLKLYVDNKYIKNIDKRTTRGDVNTAVSGNYGGTGKTPKAGFEIEYDVSSLAAGKHTIKVEEVSRFGEVVCKDEKTIKVGQVEYKGKMNIESFPLLTYTLPNSNTMNVYGWAVSDDIGSYMIIEIDGKQYPCTTVRTKRPDVDSAVSGNYGGTASTPKAGFSMNVDIRNLQEGMHTVVVSEVSRFHKIMASAKIQLKIQTPNYTGLMNVESPIRNKRYRSDWLEVKGWAITEENGDFIKIYLDGHYQTTAQATSRPDVVGVHGSKYPKHSQYTGFISNINATNLSEGTHTVRIEHCSRYGKTIQVTDIPITISNTQTWGIDVSHYQETIDWNAVRNQGVNFAILKIGEYRESSGTILVDDRFEEYYNACKRLGIAVGGYFYSYAFDAREAANEANACVSVIRGKTFEMPIFFDIEDKMITNAVNSGRTNKDNLTNAALTFCDILNANGYKAGVYSYKNFFYSYLNMSALEKYNVWLAHYVNATDYNGKYDMWQYTSAGSVPGINGLVDLNWCFKRYY